jgi:hypothetical protein
MTSLEAAVKRHQKQQKLVKKMDAKSFEEVTEIVENEGVTLREAINIWSSQKLHDFLLKDIDEATKLFLEDEVERMVREEELTKEEAEKIVQAEKLVKIMETDVEKAVDILFTADCKLDIATALEKQDWPELKEILSTMNPVEAIKILNTMELGEELASRLEQGETLEEIYPTIVIAPTPPPSPKEEETLEQPASVVVAPTPKEPKVKLKRSLSLILCDECIEANSNC